jgi:hypothetical protein
MRLAPVLLIATACSKPPPPKAPPKEQAADTVADIVGRWVADDDLDWGYSMTIAPAGTIDVWIDRGKMGRCEQRGTIEAAGSRTFTVTYTHGDCNPQAVGVPIEMHISAFDGSSLTVLVGNEHRTYTHAP